ncbi:MAG: hypothetical protein V9G20_30375 [Candidatus Promineifilaceae bacterium]
MRRRRQAVWEALNDADRARGRHPRLPPASTGPGRIRSNSRSQVNLGVDAADLQRPTSCCATSSRRRAYTLAGRGRGGLLGKAEAAADIVLADDRAAAPNSAFGATGGADGGIMKLGKALIGKSAQKVIDGFFAQLRRARFGATGDAAAAGAEPRGPRRLGTLPAQILTKCSKNCGCPSCRSGELQDCICPNARGMSGRQLPLPRAKQGDYP